jgi:hypothetical protein
VSGPTIRMYDLDSNLIADITGIALSRVFNSVHNGASSFIVEARANHPLLTGDTDWSSPTWEGTRKLVVWDDGDTPGVDDPIFHGRIGLREINGDGRTNRVTLTAFDAWMELGYQAGEQAGRVVRGSTNQPTAGSPFGEYDGNFIDPKFASSVVGQTGISGPDLIFQAFTNSTQTGAESDPSPGEGPLPIKLDGTFDLNVPPAVDLSVEDSMGWPVMLGDFVAQLVATNVCDVVMKPINPVVGQYEMVQLSAVSLYDTDKSATVHFDYWTGSKNAKACRYVADFYKEICNKLYLYLGPQLDPEHWRGNITPGATGTTVDPTASRALYGGPAVAKGDFMFIRVLDSLGTENSSRPLYLALWNAEANLRKQPRPMLFITPNSGSKSLFAGPADFKKGDTVAINTGAPFGLALADVQRVYGFAKTWTREGVAQLSQLVTSADVA